MKHRERLARTLDQLFQRARIGAPYKLSFLETQTLSQFIVELTAQNADLAAWKAQAIEFLKSQGYEEKVEDKAPSDWTPFA